MAQGRKFHEIFCGHSGTWGQLPPQCLWFPSVLMRMPHIRQEEKETPQVLNHSWKTVLRMPRSNLIKHLFIATHSSFTGFREQRRHPCLLITKPVLLTFSGALRSIIIETYIAHSDLRTEAGMSSMKNETHLLYL